MLCGEIILPKTPPVEFVAAISVGLSPSWFAATTCILPNRALPEVSLPVRNTAIHPRKADTKGNHGPTATMPRPRLYVIPE